MIVFGVVRRPPAFGDYLALAHDHHAVHPFDLLIEGVHKLQHRGGGNALRFGRSARQRAGGLSRPHGSSQDKDEADSDQSFHRKFWCLLPVNKRTVTNGIPHFEARRKAALWTITVEYAKYAN